jgi:hypothetical protein
MDTSERHRCEGKRVQPLQCWRNEKVVRIGWLLFVHSINTQQRGRYISKGTKVWCIV